MKKGYIQIYTGSGKGKTTAAIGLAIRAAGAGLRVYIIQFLKKSKCSEYQILKRIKNIKVKSFGSGCFIYNKAKKNDFVAAQKALKSAKKIIFENRCDVCILDELFSALYFKMIDENDILDLLKSKPETMEIIITGRNATKKILRIADLVTEMKEVKHYFNNGVKARVGIEK